MEDFAQIDPKLQQACQQASATNSMTPLIKQELQLTILHRRHMSGKGEVEEEPKITPVKRELTEAELEKKRRRKEQNRRAAERCRIKKKKMNDKLNLEFQEEQKKSHELAKEVEQLKKDRAMLLQLLRQHSCTSGLPLPNFDEDFTLMTWSPPPQQAAQFNYEPLTPTGESYHEAQLAGSEIKTEPQSYPPCTVTQSNQMQTDVLQFGETAGPFGDPFEDEAFMYPPYSNEIKPECQPLPTCTLVQEPGTLAELDFLNEFVTSDGRLSPCSPSMMQGRVSISDYVDLDH